MAPVTVTRLLQYVVAAAIFIPSRGALAQSQIPLKLDHDALSSQIDKSVIVHMFEWTWDSIAAECTEFLGPAGYGYVQGKHLIRLRETNGHELFSAASPAQEHVQGPQWWTDYQPVSYNLTSKRGNRQQFANMIKTCHTAGVKVIAGMHSCGSASHHDADACSPILQTLYSIIWHSTKMVLALEAPSSVTTTTQASTTTRMAISITAILPPTTRSSTTKTASRSRPVSSIISLSKVNTSLLVEVMLIYLPVSLATETEHVRSRLAEYANDLLSLGVDGLRLDAAKRMCIPVLNVQPLI